VYSVTASIQSASAVVQRAVLYPTRRAALDGLVMLGMMDDVLRASRNWVANAKGDVACTYGRTFESG
jgi:hypothetical protein